MKITDIRVHGGRLSSLAFVEVETDEGLTGIGVTGSPSWIIRPIILDRQGGLIRFLLGQDPLEPRRLWLRMFQDWQSLRGRGGEGGMAVNAMGAVDMALWDLAGKALNQPLYKLLGGAVQSRVMAYASETAFDLNSLDKNGPPRLKSAEQLAALSRASVQQGFRAIKFGWGNHFRDEDEERLAAIREAIGPETRLMLDFGCPAYWTPGWNLKEAIRATRFLESFELYFLEEPLPPFNVDGYAALSQAVEVNIASGESLSTTHEFQHFIDRRALDIVQPDAAQIGVTQFCYVVRQAEEAGLLCIPHSLWSATVVATHLHILATVNNGSMVEYPGLESLTLEITRMTHEAIIEHPLKLKDGYLELSKNPGLGLGNYIPEALSSLEHLAAQGE